VLLFTGHRIDAPNRRTPRFPAASEAIARAMIEKSVSSADRTAGDLLGISGGASGGDILFQEVCRERAIPTMLYLALPGPEYTEVSVRDAGPGWVTRFQRLVQQTTPEILPDADSLPRGLETNPEYSVWQRSTLWMLHSALEISHGELTLIALWDGAAGDGPGGTNDMVQRMRDRGLSVVHLDAGALTARA
jgi:hypothetical protein